MPMPASSSANANGFGKTSNEVQPKTERRRFTAEYKLKILEETDKAPPGEVGAILRREGLYSSLLAEWRKARRRATLKALAEPAVGRPAAPDSELKSELARLQKHNQQLETRLKRTELLLEIQKKAFALLEVAPSDLTNSAAPEVH